MKYNKVLAPQNLQVLLIIRENLNLSLKGIYKRKIHGKASKITFIINQKSLIFPPYLRYCNLAFISSLISKKHSTRIGLNFPHSLSFIILTACSWLTDFLLGLPITNLSYSSASATTCAPIGISSPLVRQDILCHHIFHDVPYIFHRQFA